MTHTLHDVYLQEHLAPQIAFEPGETYWDILRLMYEKEFVWFVPNDDNRIVDGLDLRTEWMDHVMEVIDQPLPEFNVPCSFLEVLIALSRRLAFIAGESAEGWAWQLMINLDLHRMKDPLSRYKTRKADDIFEAVIWRTYERDGSGGFFPLGHPHRDQRKVELWYQMNAYVEEIHPEY